MATWTTIADTTLEPGKPARSIDAIALRDNPIAIAEGAAGAPRIVYAALNLSNDLVNSDVANGTLGAEKFQTGTAERDWVLQRTASASVGAVGTYAFLELQGDTTLNAGDTTAGSNLRYTGHNLDDSGTPSGTWRCMGRAVAPLTNDRDATVFLRIS